MQKVTVMQRDFERYIFPVEFKQLLSFGKKKFIFSELEKRHPCFTDDFCFDNRFSYGRNGLVADVIVIRRNKLLEYQKKNGSFWGLNFETCRQKRFLNSNCFLKIVFLFIVATSVFLIFRGNIVGTKKEEIINENRDSLIKETISEEHPEENQKLYESLFEIIKQEKGKMENLCWKVSGGKEIVDFTVNNIYPEVLKDLIPNLENEEFSSVLYQNGIPQFQYSMRSYVGFKHSTEAVSNSSYKKELRELLLKNDCLILEENISSNYIRFICNEEEILKAIEDILCKNEISIVELMLDVANQKNKDVIQIKLVLEEQFDYQWGFRLGALLENREIFFSEKIKANKSANTEIKEREKASVPMGYKKIGEVKCETGTKVLFYKNEVGKILKVME